MVDAAPILLDEGLAAEFLEWSREVEKSSRNWPLPEVSTFLGHKSMPTTKKFYARFAVPENPLLIPPPMAAARPGARRGLPSANAVGVARRRRFLLPGRSTHGTDILPILNSIFFHDDPARRMVPLSSARVAPCQVGRPREPPTGAVDLH
jgi:hypothetical protein